MNDTSDVPHELGRATDIDDTEPVSVVDPVTSWDEPDHGPDTAPVPVLPAPEHRHRPAPGTWTPPTADGGGASHARTEPIPRITSPIAADAEFTSESGVLPVTDDESAPEKPVTRRRRVLLTTPTGGAHAADEENGRHRAARPRGLGKFNLGSVPASVTPPRTWRKAAWFASAASGAAVAAMLLVGTALVSEPSESTRALETWPDNSSRQPTLPGGGDEDAPRSGPTSDAEKDDNGHETDTPVGTVPTTHRESGFAPTSGPGDETGEPGGYDPPVVDAGEGPESGIGESEPAPAAPSKPPVTPAPTGRAPVVLWAPYDSGTLAQVSQDYFNLVTEDPAAAHALTTGELAALGPEGLAAKYADVAYFEVREVYVDPHEGYTLNTLDVTYVDGTSERQTRKLVFSEDELIEADTL